MNHLERLPGTGTPVAGANKLRFAVLVIGFGAACALLFLSFYGDAKDAAVARLQEQQLIHARQAARGVEDFFSTWTSILAAYSRLEEIVELDDNGRRGLKLFFEAYGEQVRSVTRMDERGIILASYPFRSAEGSDISGQRHVREILRDHRPVVSDVFRAVQGFDAVALHVPVFKGAAFKGSVAVVVNFESLAKRYFDVIRVGEDGYAWVVSRDGTLLYSPVPGLTGTKATESFKAFPSLVDTVAGMLQGREGVATYTYDRIAGKTVAPVRKYARYLPIRLGNTFWSVAVASTEQELLAGLNSYKNRLALVVGLVYVGGMFLAIVAARGWLIVKEEEKRLQAELALRASEQKFMKAFFATPDAIVISRVADGLLLEVNETFQRQTGHTRAEALGQTTVGLGLWADPADRDRYVAAVRAEGRVREMEARFVTKSGAVLDGLVSGEGIEIDGEPCLLTIIRDITERKRAEVAATASQALLQDITDNSASLIYACDQQGRFLLINRRLETLFGLPRETLIGKRREAVMPPEIAAAHLASDLKVMADLQPIAAEEENSEADGSHTYLSVKFPLIDPQGRVRGVGGISTDITERIKAEERLKGVNEELLAVNRIVMACASTMDADEILDKVMDEALQITGLEGGTICFVTPEETLQIAAHRATSAATIEDLSTHAVKVGDCLCGECARDLKPLILADRQAVLEYSTREATRGEDIRFHAAFPLITGERCVGVLCVFTKTDVKPSERSLKLLETVSAQIALAIENARLYAESLSQAALLEKKVQGRTAELAKAKAALLNLVEDLNGANQRLQELDRLKSMFIASMSHELRTPLNSIIGFSGILLQGLAGELNQEQRDQLERVFRAGKHLLSLITDVIDIAKIESGKIQAYAEEFVLQEVIQEACESVKIQLKDKGLELRLDLPEVPLTMKTDRRRLMQCLINYLGNAVKFTLQGSVAVSVREEGETVTVCVTDTGIGIKESNLGLLFTSFVRLDSPLKMTTSGTGLGLYLTKKLVTEVLGGEVHAESVAGTGSTFSLTIPSILPAQKQIG